MIKFDKRIIRSLIFLACSVLLSACLSPVATTTTHTYVLNSMPSRSAIKNTRTHEKATVLVTTTTADLAYASTQMAYTTYPHQLAYFAVNAWAEPPAAMLTPLLLQTLQRTHAFHAVVGAPSADTQYVLRVEVLELLQDFTQKHHPILHFKLKVTLSNAASSHVIASKLFSETMPIYPANPYGGVVAANQATVLLLQQIGHFCIEYS